MAFGFHVHAFPGCGTTHHTSCNAVAPTPATSTVLCDRIDTGINRGKYACRHVPPGGRVTAADKKVLRFIGQILGKRSKPHRHKARAK